MSKLTAVTVWIVVLVAVAAAGIAPAPAAPHFPRMLTGSFSGQDHFFTWQGTVSLEGRRRQTTYAYGGKATYTWTLKSPTTPSGDCQLVPSSGVIVEEVGVSVNRTRSGKAGYSYDGGNGAGGGTGEIKRVCPDPIDNSDFGPNQIQGAFGSPLGGNSKTLRRFAGSNSSGEYKFQWSFVGRK